MDRVLQKPPEKPESLPRPTIVPYRCGKLRGLCVEGYEQFDLGAIPWDDLRRAPEPNLRLAKASRTRRVVRLDFAPRGRPPRPVYAKRVSVRDWRKRLGCLFVGSKARHEWEAGFRLREKGIATALPVVYAELRRGPWLIENYLVTEAIADARPLRLELELLDSPSARCELLLQLAGWLSGVHHLGFYHDDCSTQHIFVSPLSGPPPEGQRRFWFIDLDNSRFYGATVPWRLRVKNLFQLLRSVPAQWASRDERLYFVEAYLEATAETERKARAIAAMRRLARAKEAPINI